MMMPQAIIRGPEYGKIFLVVLLMVATVQRVATIKGAFDFVIISNV